MFPGFRPKSPNREVGDRSFQPTRDLQGRRSQIPQPLGWGIREPLSCLPL